MSVVLKWTVPVDGGHHPIGEGPVILVACQDKPGLVQVWTIENGYNPPQTRRARVYATGEPIQPATHLGSVALPEGLVWHLFDLSSPRTAPVPGTPGEREEGA